MKKTSKEVIDELCKILDATPKKTITMTPQKKAKELVDKFSNVPLLDSYEAKQCALIAVDEILKSHNNLYGVNGEKTKYYLEVKQEIELL
jgi:hypothetical protein